MTGRAGGVAGTDVVVVLSWFGHDDTIGCVASLLSGSRTATVLVVDNGSFDGTLDSVRTRWPEVHTLQLPVNLGFAGGMNAGLRWGLDRGARTVTVLNNDTTIPPGAVDRLAALALEGTVAVSPTVVYAGDPSRLWFGGGRVDVETGLPRHLTRAEVATEVATAPGGAPRRTPLLAGCCVTASAATWGRAGLFDEAYFLTFEDSEWSLRATGQGVRLLVDPQTTIRHTVSASFTGGAAYLGLFYYARNGLRFIQRVEGRPAGDAARFLRRHVVPLVAAGRTVRGGGPVEAARRAVVVAWALAAHATGQTGAAPRQLARLSRRWIRSRA